MSVVLLSGRFKMGVSLPSGIEIAAEKRLFLKENDEITGNRKFVGLAVRMNGRLYVVPLTSQTTKERVARGKKNGVQR